MSRTAVPLVSPQWLWTGMLLAIVTAVCAPLAAPSADAAAVIPEQRHGKRLALLIGVGQYNQSGEHPWRRLQVAADLERLRSALLLPQHGFRSADIMVLRDDAATAAGIRAAVLHHLIENASPGAVIVLYFAGHGQRILDDNEDELDCLDESIVPFDAMDQRASAGARVNIRDDEIRSWVVALQRRMQVNGRITGSINLFFDTCVAGGVARSPFHTRGRGWQPELDGALPACTPRHRPLHRDGLLDSPMPGYVLLAAAQEDQEAIELEGGGVFTRALVTALRRATPQTTYGSLYDQLWVEVNGQVRDQTPVLLGESSLLLWSGQVGPPAPLAVSGNSPTALLLHAGALQFVTVGSLYALYGSGQQPISQSAKLAEAKVAVVGSTTSRLQLISTATSQAREPTIDVLYRRAVELHHQAEQPRLNLHLANLDDQQELLERLHQLEFLQLVGRNEQRPDLALQRCAGQLILRRAGRQEPLVVLPAIAQSAGPLEQSLRREWRWHQFAGLETPDSDLKVALTIVPVQSDNTSCRILPGVPERQLQPRSDLSSGKNVTLHPGDHYSITLTNLTGTELYVTAFEIDPDGCINLLYPQQPGGNLLAGWRTVMFPEQLDFCVQGTLGRSLIKVVATREQVNLMEQLKQAHAETCMPPEQAAAVRSPGFGFPYTSPGAAEQLLESLRSGLLGAPTGARAQTRQVRLIRGSWGVTTSSLDLCARAENASGQRARAELCL